MVEGGPRRQVMLRADEGLGQSACLKSGPDFQHPQNDEKAEATFAL